ncbi:MAG: hypothetical protein R2828_29840 [Saprospiraceae bacterium]
MKIQIVLISFFLIVLTNSTAQTVELNEERIEAIEKELPEIGRRIDRRKSEISKNETALTGIQKSANSTSSKSNEIDSLKSQIEILKEKIEDRNQLFESLLSTTNQASSNIGNQMDGLSNLIGIGGLILAIFTIIISVYINNKEKRISNLLDRGEEILRKQQEVKNLIDSDFTSVYKKIKAEEINDIVKTIATDSFQIRTHLSRMLTLKFNESEFGRFRNILLNWITDEKAKSNVEYLLVFLVNKFPSIMAGNQELTPFLLPHWKQIYRSITSDKIEKFIVEFRDKFLKDEHEDIGEHFAKILLPISEYYSSEFISRVTLFEEVPDKKSRFKILKLLKENSLNSLLMFYENRVLSEYMNSEDNTEEEQKLVEEFQEKIKPKKQEEKKEENSAPNNKG